MTDAKDSKGGAKAVHATEARLTKKFEWKRLIFIFLGLGLFSAVYLSPAWPDAVDPNGQHFVLSPQGKSALALFLLAATWWVFEVVPIGVTGIVIGVVQALFLIRPDVQRMDGETIKGTWVSFTDFLAPSVWFIIGSIVIGMVFSKTGLTKRLAYKMLAIVGEKTSMILLGTFVMTTALTHIMAHTAVAAAVFPLLVTIYSLYSDDDKPSKYGKALFMGMAFVAGAGSIITLLGAARGAVALGFYNEIVFNEAYVAQLAALGHRPTEIGFFTLTKYMAPIGWGMTFLLWGFFLVFFPAEHKTIPGLRERAKGLSKRLGRMTRNEIIVLVITFAAIGLMSMSSFVPALARIDKSGIILTAIVIFFLLKILDIKDLEAIPWNIVLLFGGAMSIGYCLWQTGAARWLAVNWLMLFQNAHWFIFVMGIAFFVLIMTNFIMNVAAIAISLPVALVIAPYLHVAPEVIFFASLVTAGMPFLLLVGAAPNAIAYESRQFTSGEFFLYGIPASILLMVVLGLAIWFLWPLMGMPIYLEGPPG